MATLSSHIMHEKPPPISSVTGNQVKTHKNFSRSSKGEKIKTEKTSSLVVAYLLFHIHSPVLIIPRTARGRPRESSLPHSAVWGCGMAKLYLLRFVCLNNIFMIHQEERRNCKERKLERTSLRSCELTSYVYET